MKPKTLLIVMLIIVMGVWTWRFENLSKEIRDLRFTIYTGLITDDSLKQFCPEIEGRLLKRIKEK